jgi:hypothetical protein
MDRCGDLLEPGVGIVEDREQGHICLLI